MSDIDATLASAKGGGGIGPTKRGKGVKIMAIVASATLCILLKQS